MSNSDKRENIVVG